MMVSLFKNLFRAFVCAGAISAHAALGDTVQYTDSPGSYQPVTVALSQEFGTATFPPLIETEQTTYLVAGDGPVDLSFRFTDDTGAFLFDFGFYRITPSLSAIDLSTDAGKIAYASQALAPGNAMLVFSDAADNPGASRIVTASGGDVLGLFLVPDATLQQFQTSPGTFGLNGVGSARLSTPGPLRYPLFSVSNANPENRDQLMSFSGVSPVTGEVTNLFAWEDLTRATIPNNPFPSDNRFNDLIFAVEGVRVVPEPGSLRLLSGTQNTTGVRSGSTVSNSGPQFVTMLPASGSISRMAGGSSATNTYEFSIANGQTIFDWDFAHVTDGLVGSAANSLGIMRFTVDADTPYEVSGLYQSEGLPWIVQWANLLDLTTNSNLLDSYNFSQHTPDEVFVIGQPTGDSTVGMTGSTTGMLLANHSYEFEYSWYVEPVNQIGSRATGNMRLAVGVPESTTWDIDAHGNWTPAGNWTAGIPNARETEAVFGGVITVPRIVTVDVPVTVRRIEFDNENAYTITGANSLTLAARSGDAHITVTSGSHTISAPMVLADDTVITVAPAASNLSITGALNASGRNLTKAGAGALTVNHVRAAALSVDGGTVAMVPNGTATGTSVVGALSIAGDATPTAKADLNNNAAIIDYSGASPAATVRSQILAGRGGPGFDAAWTGQGITSSAAAAANAAEPESRSIGYAENATLPLGPYTTFGGQPVDDTSLLITYTRTGDANLDGVVNDDDVTIVGAAYAPGVPQPHWALGDFDYNGFVDDDDVTLLGVFYDPSAPPLAVPTTEVAAVPEPRTVALLFVGLGALLAGSLARRQNKLITLIKPAGGAR